MAAIGSGPAAYRSIVGNRFGLGPNGPLYNGRPVGGSMPTGLGRGDTYYVDDARAGKSGTSPEEAVATLDEAFALCTANQGDTIVVLPDHEETVTGAAGIAHDVAGVSVIGLGTGNQRPRFLMDAGTAVSYAISAADAYVENLVFAGGHNGIVLCFDITAVGATLKDIEFEDNTTDEHFLTAIKATSTTDNNADRLTIDGCKYYTLDSGALEFLELNADVDDLTFTNNFYCADAATAGKMILQATGKDLRGTKIIGNTLISGMTTGDIFIDNDTAVNTGVAAYNLVGHHDTAGAVPFDCTGIRLFENYSTGSDTAQGMLLPIADVDT